MRQWTIATVNIDDLIPHSKNPRSLSKEDCAQLRKSIAKFGLIDLPVVTKDNRIIGGHQRLNMLKEMNVREVQCWVPTFDDLTEQDIDELNIRLNKNQGEWDWDILANEWDINDLVEWGFKDEDFDESKPEKKKKPSVSYEFSDKEDLQHFMSQVEALGNERIEKTKVKL